MTSKERVRRALRREVADRIPAHFNATGYIWDRLKEHFGVGTNEEVLALLAIDTRDINPDPVNGPVSERRYINEKDYEIEGQWGGKRRAVWTGIEYNNSIVEWPLDGTDDQADIDQRVRWPEPSWFDYGQVAKDVEVHADKALIVGHWGPFQTCTALRRDDQIYLDMAANPDFAKKLFDRMHRFQMWHYENIFKAGKGGIDVLRTHDDYGTQISTLVSPAMWEDYFAENTRELVDLAHRHGAFFWQHSCGCVRNIIPQLIACGIDALEPIQPVRGMSPEEIRDAFGGKLTFVGGIDTQQLLPFGTPDQVRREVRRYMTTLGRTHGYILYPSQALESCVPVKNIKAAYELDLRSC